MSLPGFDSSFRKVSPELSSPLIPLISIGRPIDLYATKLDATKRAVRGGNCTARLNIADSKLLSIKKVRQPIFQNDPSRG